MVMGLLFAVLGLIWMAFQVRDGTRFGTKAGAFLDGSMVGTGHNLPLVLIFLCLAGILGGAVYVFAWFKYSALYGAVFLRLTPVVLFAALVSAHGFISLLGADRYTQSACCGSCMVSCC
jgi:hypothetical protein